MNIDITSITKSIARKKRGLEDPQLINPSRDWAIGIIGTLVLIFGATIFSVVQYQRYTDLSMDEEVVVSLVPYRAAVVEQAIEKYSARAAAHSAILQSVSEAETVGVSTDSVINEEESDQIVTPTEEGIAEPSLVPELEIPIEEEPVTVVTPDLAI
jgi:hypothetical protein